jgi:hypothetical protein
MRNGFVFCGGISACFSDHYFNNCELVVGEDSCLQREHLHILFLSKRILMNSFAAYVGADAKTNKKESFDEARSFWCALSSAKVVILGGINAAIVRSLVALDSYRL